MGEGEVCLEVVADVGEMENEKIQQKRDHQWLTGDSDLEPFAKKQAKDGSVDVDVDPCSRNQLEVGHNSVEQEPSAEKLPMECLNDTGLEPFVEQNMQICSEEMEHEPCGRKQTTEPPKAIGPDPSDGGHVKQCLQGMEQEPCGRKQETENSNDPEVEPSAGLVVKEGPSNMEQEPCGTKHSLEVSDNIKIEPNIEQSVKEHSDEIQFQPCARNPTMLALNDTKLETHGEQSVSEFSNVAGLEPDGRMQKPGAGNDIEPEPCGRMQKTGAGTDIELGCGGMQTTEIGSNIEIEPSVEQPVKNCQSDMELEVSGRKQMTEALNDTEPEAPNDTEPEALNDTEPEASVQQSVKESLNEMELEVFGREHATQALNDTEIEPCAMKQTTEALNGTELEPFVEQSINEEMVLDPCIKKEVKEASNDDICSEVSDPNVSPRDNASSFQIVSSQSVGKLAMKDQVVCGDITSTCSGNSTSEGSSSEEEHAINDTSRTVSTSHVVLEIPKHASSSGIRKITFKFSKRKEDYDNQLSASAALSLSDAFDSGTNKVPRLTHISGQRLHETSDSLLHPTNVEVMMSRKLVPESYPTTVKRLLSTRILEGAKVKYISTSGELIGIVKDCGYLCGCATCNFSNILRAHEFEEHAGGKTRHPNNHIFLENGKPIYSIIQEMKTAPLSTVDEAIKNVAGSSVNKEFLQAWKESLQRNMDACKTDNYHTKLMNLYHSKTSHMREESSSSYSCYRKSLSLEPQTSVNETIKERKRQYKKSRSSISGTAVEHKRSAEGGHKKRDNDLHRLLFMPNGLPDGTELGYYARGKKILDGYKQGNGIVCSHCDTEISPSQFEAHAGWAAKRQPYRHIYISNGLTLHDIALLLANGQSIATSNSDDMCAVCGDRGDLIICDGCPRAFHAVCLGLEGVPTEDWHCPYCRDNIGSGRKAAAESKPIVIRLTRVVKAREYEAGGCVICRAHDFSVAEFDDRTVMLCDQCEKEYHVGCLRESGICDLKALPLDKWFCCDHCDMIHDAIQEVVSNGAAGVSASVLSTINKKHIEKGVTDGAPNQLRWRMLSGKSRYPEHLPLLSRAAAIFRECFDPIVAKSGRDLIPVMVYGRNISGQEFGGIYCIVLMVGSAVVSAGLLRIFGREVAELPLVATSRQYQGKGYFQALFSCIEELLLSLGVENLVLPAAEEAESIWTKKLGFRKMSDERYSQYSRDIQLTIFKGTSMLEKELRP